MPMGLMVLDLKEKDGKQVYCDTIIGVTQLGLAKVMSSVVKGCTRVAQALDSKVIKIK